MGLHRRRVWDIAKGFRGRAKNCFKIARQQAEKALQHAYTDRRNKKTNMRALWNQRINAAAREHGLKYSWLMHGLRQDNIQLNRKMLSELAIFEPHSFRALVQQATQLLDNHTTLPKCIVLDLDYTVWPFWCEMYSEHDTPPGLYPDAEGIIDACRQRGILVAAASRTPTPHVARAFLQKTGLDAKFDSIQLIPAANGYDSHSAQKDACHLPAIKASTGLQWADMLFFDDEGGNVRKVSRLGVCSVQVPTSLGLCCKTFAEGLHKYAQQHSS